MALPLYLARTMAEMAGNFVSSPMAYLACHFSPGGPGLSNLPDKLPPGAMLILDDSTPMDRHDPERILKQLSAQVEQHGCESILLDFQRPEILGQGELAALLSDSLLCPVGVSALYAQGLNCPVFLPPVPPDRHFSDHLTPWQGREIWLEAALDGLKLVLTETGCTVSPLFGFPENGLSDGRLHCHYTTEADNHSAIFHLWRTQEDLDALLKDAKKAGITKAIGLWQELH
jgi:hypothetical protein